MKYIILLFMILFIVGCQKDVEIVRGPAIPDFQERMADTVFKNPNYYASYSFTQEIENDIYSDTREIAINNNDYFESNTFTNQEVKQANFYLIDGTSYNCVLTTDWSCLEFPEKTIFDEQEKQNAIQEARDSFMNLNIIQEPSKLIVDTQARCFSFNMTNFTVKECYSPDGVILYQKTTYEDYIVKSEELIANFYSLQVKPEIFKLPATPELITEKSEVAK